MVMASGEEKQQIRAAEHLLMASGEDHKRLTDYLEAQSIREEQICREEEEEEEVVQATQLQRTIVHVTDCRTLLCSYPFCLIVKSQFYHVVGCRPRIPGGCPLCNKLGFLLHLHALDCQQSQCRTPCCRDLKDRHQQQQRQHVMNLDPLSGF
ncbi:histone acetyltransferase [Salvia divinorum]|uniref:histone acetyltransferase n=1 Tax=Salvia divinorum TaxID=28513 RepID=A0ABD1I088_SALDI